MLNLRICNRDNLINKDKYYRRFVKDTNLGILCEDTNPGCDIIVQAAEESVLPGSPSDRPDKIIHCMGSLPSIVTTCKQAKPYPNGISSLGGKGPPPLSAYFFVINFSMSSG